MGLMFLWMAVDLSFDFRYAHCDITHIEIAEGMT